MENKEDGKEKQKSGFVINIPSYQEVIDSSLPKTTAPSLFNPSPSFSQSFNFIKNTEFYAPPAPPPQPPSQPHNVPAPREIGNGASSSSTSQNAPSRNAILVSFRQKGNPLLKHIRNVRWAFADILCDYSLGPNSCALYLSLRYHLLHPDYLYYRIRELQNNFKLKVVLCHVDVEDVIKPLLEVTKTALLHDCTLLCGWSLEECGRYLETIKVYENKPADIIQGQMDTDYLSRLTHALTTVRHVNKTDVVTLGSTFGTLSHIMDASMEDLSRCPGIGERKVKRLYDTFHEPFKRVIAAKRPSTSEAAPLDLCPETEGKEVAEASEGNKKEPELTVKSALAAAFARHKEKVGEKNKKPQGGEGPKESGSEDSKPGNKNSSEGARS